MVTLYQVAQSNNGIVVGTGNKVEDFGVGFYTKYGDGGVDISPIADCNKTEIWELGKELKILKEIIEAAPTDGLWDDGRTDEGQLGLKYSELEEAMKTKNLKEIADALTDILYVTYGAGCASGIDLDKCFKEVQRANMSKLGKDGKHIYNEKGKVMKGPNYFKPNLLQFVK